MSEVKTVRIMCDWREDGFLFINESDFHSGKHELWLSPEEKAAAEKADAAKAKNAA